MALYATALRESGRYILAAGVAFLSLVLAGLVAIMIVPRLVRRTALEHWMMRIEYEFTREGIVYIVIILVIGLAALNTGNNLLFIIEASLLAGILVSGILSRLVLERLELKMDLPEHVFAERVAAATLTLSNRKHVFPSFSISVSAKAKNKRKRRRLLAPAPRQILDQPVYIPYIPRRSSVTQRVELMFPRRGRYTQDGFRVSTQFPFSLLRKAHEATSRQEVIVLPSVKTTEEFSRILASVGSRTENASKGYGQDLYAIRDYQQSDAARHVDWKASAKTQALKVREFTREDDRRFTLVFDRRTQDSNPEALDRFEKAVKLCACLAWQFYEMDAMMQFVTEDIATGMLSAAEIIFPVLERLALMEPDYSTSPSIPFWADASRAAEGFRIVLTAQTRASIPTGDWTSTHFVFIDEMSTAADR